MKGCKVISLRRGTSARSGGCRRSGAAEAACVCVHEGDADHRRAPGRRRGRAERVRRRPKVLQVRRHKGEQVGIQPTEPWRR